MSKKVTYTLPKVVREDYLKVTDNFSVRVCMLDDGRRIIPKEEMIKICTFMGLSLEELEYMINNR